MPNSLHTPRASCIPLFHPTSSVCQFFYLPYIQGLVHLLSPRTITEVLFASTSPMPVAVCQYVPHSPLPSNPAFSPSAPFQDLTFSPYQGICVCPLPPCQGLCAPHSAPMPGLCMCPHSPSPPMQGLCVAPIPSFPMLPSSLLSMPPFPHHYYFSSFCLVDKPFRQEWP